MIDENKILETINFAMGGFSEELTMLQIKLNTLGIRAIQAEENPRDQPEYVFKIKDIAKLLNVTQWSLSENLMNAAAMLWKLKPDLILVNEDGKPTLTTIYQSITPDQENGELKVRFSYEYRRTVIAMKQKHDLMLNYNVILSFKHKYTFYFYNLLLAEAALENTEEEHADNRYIYEVEKDRLMDLLHFSGSTGNFHKRALIFACEELNKKTEIFITNLGEDKLPEKLMKGRKVLAYRINYIVKANYGNPVFSKIESLSTREYPTKKELFQLMLEEGVNENFVRGCFKQYPIERIWSCFIVGMIRDVKDERDRPKLINASITQNYGAELRGVRLEAAFKYMYESLPRLQAYPALIRIYGFYKKQEDDPFEEISTPKRKYTPEQIREMVASLKNDI